jgi:hypothetical protein
MTTKRTTMNSTPTTREVLERAAGLAADKPEPEDLALLLADLYAEGCDGHEGAMVFDTEYEVLMKMDEAELRAKAAAELGPLTADEARERAVELARRMAR